MTIRYQKKLIFLFFIMSILVTGCSIGKSKVIESGKTLSMYIATDIHYLADSIHDNGKAYQNFSLLGDGRMVQYVDDIVNAFGYDIKINKPDILILSGDLTTNGEKASHLKLAEKLEEIEKSTGTRIYVIPGNHDIDNPWARGFQGTERYKTPSVNASEFEKIYKDFGYDEAISKDKDSLSYLAAPSKDVRLLMLDTCEYQLNPKTGTPVTNGEIRESTLEWIRKCCKEAQEKNIRIVTVMHHNLYDHSPRIHYGFTLDNSEEVEKVFRENNLDLVLSGHVHIQDIKSKEESGKRIYEITTASLIMYPIQYGVLKYNPVTGFDYSTSQVDVDTWAREKGIEDNTLMDFMSYSKLFLADNTYRKVYTALTKTGLYTEDEKEAMAETMSLLNVNYLKGTTGSIKDAIVCSKGYKLWIKAGETEDLEHLRSYFLSMIPSNDTTNNSLHIN
ncbi:metallophosphoesterase [Anaerocolumna xylanovorans]|uniref:3',5'-cyclic AMP phosphodiesterase CpdA n=1 Tax=Anaerocolumna xylanovorans DSM 12503 TaxID=1121345 RepID=A0A1M7Y1H5_9FIRM|nr:metallophosphoesterase [Anaerocolumna xylanovorans]SHO45568.1 3',5'-cyclic AMP phosphodiesterase CpdA [Anaerocolumna xylanovorans DSM 12503]